MKKVKVKKGMSFRSRLYELDACGCGLAWAGNMSAKTAWQKCERADWMLWLALGYNHEDDFDPEGNMPALQDALAPWVGGLEPGFRTWQDTDIDIAIRSAVAALYGAGGLGPDDSQLLGEASKQHNRDMCDAIRKIMPYPPARAYNDEDERQP